MAKDIKLGGIEVTRPPLNSPFSEHILAPRREAIYQA